MKKAWFNNLSNKIRYINKVYLSRFYIITLYIISIVVCLLIILPGIITGVFMIILSSVFELIGTIKDWRENGN